MTLQPSRSLRLVTGLAAVLVLAGCASLSADGQRSAVTRHL